MTLKPDILPDLPLEGAGVGLRHQHLAEMEYIRPPIHWLEVHTENFFFSETKESELLFIIREFYPLSAHSVGLSLGSADGVNKEHLARIKGFIERFKPTLVSDHISWSSIEGKHLNDLLPLPYTEESLDIICQNVDYVQHELQRQILVENPSSYVISDEKDMTEWEFINQLVERTECGLLLDVNNIFVSSKNHDFNPIEYIQAMPGHAIGEIHLAGHTAEDISDDDTVLIDNHGSHVNYEVWELYRTAIQHFGPVPTLIEWDTDVPDLADLVVEMQKAQEILDEFKDHIHQRT